MFQLIENGKSAEIFAADGEESWVYLAAEDLQKDLCRLSGKERPKPCQRQTQYLSARFPIHRRQKRQEVQNSRQAKRAMPSQFRKI